MTLDLRSATLAVVTAILVPLTSPAAAQQASSVEEILSVAEADCAAFENGVFEPGDAVQAVDLDGEAPLDTIVDTALFSCSSMASAYCGSGGCTLWTVVGEEVTSYQAEGWRMVEWDGRPILLIARDGGWCGGAGAELCYEAVTWSAGRMLSVMPAN